MKAILVAPGVLIPASAVRLAVSRASGPGGQNVNKVSSKVELRIDLDAVVGLRADARARLLRLAEGRLDAEGRLMMTSQLTRDQSRNLEDAREKVRGLVARALIRPTPRRPTKPSKGAKERRLTSKRQQSERKRHRARSGADD
jgi:ribosome-associated protein